MIDQNNPTTPTKGTGEGQQAPPKASGAHRGDSRLQRLKGKIPPEGSPVGAGGIILAAGFLILITVGMLYGITTQWPVCELPEDNKNAAPTAGANDNRSASPTAVADAATMPTANANTSTNVNTSLANANVNRAANRNANVPPPAESPTPATTKLDADSLEPAIGPITGKTLITIKGKNFGTTVEGVSVRFGEREAQVNQVGDKSISVRAPMHSEGLVDVTIARGAESDTLPSAYTYSCPPPTGSGLFLMLIMAGALGGSIHALRSLYWYSGQGTLMWRWLPMYFALPFIGAAMAMIFSLLIFAGFVDNETGRSQALFIIAVAGLVGMFSQQAALKLTDVANAFFTKPGEGRDSEPQESLSVSQKETKSVPVSVTSMQPAEGPKEGGTEVIISGSGFNTSTTVSFGGVSAEVKSFNATSLTVATPQHAPGDVDVEVKSGNHTAKLPSTFKYVA